MILMTAKLKKGHCDNLFVAIRDELFCIMKREFKQMGRLINNDQRNHENSLNHDRCVVNTALRPIILETNNRADHVRSSGCSMAKRSYIMNLQEFKLIMYRYLFVSWHKHWKGIYIHLPKITHRIYFNSNWRLCRDKYSNISARISEYWQ